jgi:hypothetical protein
MSVYQPLGLASHNCLAKTKQREVLVQVFAILRKGHTSKAEDELGTPGLHAHQVDRSLAIYASRYLLQAQNHLLKSTA